MAKRCPSSRCICVHLQIFSNVTQFGKQFEILNFVCFPFYCPPFQVSINLDNCSACSQPCKELAQDHSNCYLPDLLPTLLIGQTSVWQKLCLPFSNNLLTSRAWIRRFGHQLLSELMKYDNQSNNSMMNRPSWCCHWSLGLESWLWTCSRRASGILHMRVPTL